MSSHEFVTSNARMNNDPEKNESTSSVNADILEGNCEDFESDKSVWAVLVEHGVEIRGALPVASENRTDTRFFNVFTVFSTSMLSLLP